MSREPSRRRRRRDGLQDENSARRLAYPIAGLVMLLAFVLLFVVNTGWPFALAIAAADLVFVALVTWYSRER